VHPNAVVFLSVKNDVLIHFVRENPDLELIGERGNLQQFLARPSQARGPAGSGVSRRGRYADGGGARRSPLVDAEDDFPPEVVGVPQGAFQWT
jgi:hypothetical protein